MNNLREIKDDILKDWLDFREEELCSLTCDEDRKHHIYFDEISARILKRVPNKDKFIIFKNTVLAYFMLKPYFIFHIFNSTQENIFI